MINSFHFTGENLIKNNTVQLEVTFLLENDYYDRIFKCNLVCKKVHKEFIFKKIKNLKSEIINNENKMINFKIKWNKDDNLTKNEIKKISNFFKNFIIVEKILKEQTWNFLVFLIIKQISNSLFVAKVNKLLLFLFIFDPIICK